MQLSQNAINVMIHQFAYFTTNLARRRLANALNLIASKPASGLPLNEPQLMRFLGVIVVDSDSEWNQNRTPKAPTACKLRFAKPLDPRADPCSAAANLHAESALIEKVDVVWSFRLSGNIVRWIWGKYGSPPLDCLEPVRKPWVSERSRHRPAVAYSTTTADHIELESGEEHDLIRLLDRDHTLERITPQPFRLTWRAHGRGFHTPDLLTVDQSASVTVWDVRPIDEQDQQFLEAITITRAACSAVGWRHQVFSGLAEITRLNLLWLNGFRRRPPWAARHETLLHELARDDNSKLGDLFAADDGTGELKSTVWHLIWRGVLAIDLNERLDEHTPVRWAE